MHVGIGMQEDATTTLIAAATRGDKDAFAQVFARHRPLLTTLCRRMLGDPALVEDAVQETALQALLHLDRLRRPDRFGSWLAGIGLNVCRMSLRNRSREWWSWEELVGGLQVREPVDDEPGPAERVEQADLAQQVRRAVNDLPVGQRSAVLLFYLSGLSYAETAATLGIEVSAVSRRLHKARDTLRQRLWRLWKEDVMQTDSQDQLVDVQIESVDENKTTSSYIVRLREVGGNRRMLPIWIDQFMARQIITHLENIPPPRPQTFAFMNNVLRASSVQLREARIERLADQVFYAIAVLGGPAGTATVDARPSDLLALASLTGAPIRVKESLLAAEGQSESENLDAGTYTRMAELAQNIRSEMAMGIWPKGLEPTPGRFEKGSEGARKVLMLAQEEAQLFNHNYIGTEHLLLGLVREGEGVAAQILISLGFDLNTVRSDVETIIGRGDRPVIGDEIGPAPRAKKVIEFAADEARQLNQSTIGTEHLLLGLVQVYDGLAARIITERGISLNRVRTQVMDTVRQESNKSE